MKMKCKLCKTNQGMYYYNFLYPRVCDECYSILQEKNNVEKRKNKK